jgi:tetratricopeptide (TPR) repeat protein
LGGAQVAVNNNTEAEVSFRRALLYLEKTENTYELMKCYERYGWMLLLVHRYSDAIAVIKRSGALGKSISAGRAVEVHLNSQLNLAYILSIYGWVARAERTASQCLRSCTAINFNDGKLRACIILARVNNYMGKYETGLEYARLGLRLAEATQSKFMGAVLHGETARLLQNLGCLDDAWTHARTALKMGEEISSTDILRIAYAALGDISLSLYDFPRALDYFRSGIENPSPGFTSGENELRYAYYLSFIGNLTESEARLRELIAASREKNLGTLCLIVEMILANILATAGRREEALQQLRNTFPEIQKKKILRFVYFYESTLFLIAMQENRISDAQLHASHFVDISRSISNPLLELFAYSCLHSANKLSDQPIPLDVDRIRQLLDFLDRNVTHPDLRPSFLAQREKFLKAIGIKLD